MKQLLNGSSSTKVKGLSPAISFFRFDRNSTNNLLVSESPLPKGLVSSR